MSQGGRPKPGYDAEKLRRLHEIDGLRPAEIAVRFGCEPSTIRGWMKRWGIPVQRRKAVLGDWGNARAGKVRVR